MTKRWVVAAALGALLFGVLLTGRGVRAEILPVPDSVRQLRTPHEDVHELRAIDGSRRLGEQRLRAAMEGDRFVLQVATRFVDGEQWDERAEMDVSHGYRAYSFAKTVQRDGSVIAEGHVDFTSGKVQWRADGVAHERTFAFKPDTYVGPMLGVVLAAVPGRSSGRASFRALVFRPEPQVYTVRAEVVSEEDFRAGGLVEPTTKLRLKADLGAVQNALFAKLIPDHYFWFTRDETPAFLAFEGSLGSAGPELRMIPERRPTRTAKAG